MMKNWANSRKLLGYEPNELPDCSTPQNHYSREATLKAKDFLNLPVFPIDNNKGEPRAKRLGFCTVMYAMGN